MDNIDRIMKEADRLGFGCSYGKYRAAYPNGSADVLPTAKQASSGKKTAACRRCGKMFVVRHGNQSYCSDECAYEVLIERQREYPKARPKYPQKRSCSICGSDFMAVRSNNLYCSKDCAREGNRRKSASWRAAQKEGVADGISL